MQKPKNSRREFLKKVCPSVAFAFFGISFFEACSTDENQSETNLNNCQEISNSNLGYVIEDCVFKIDLNHPNFSSLVEIGGWMNGYNIGLDMLFLRISAESIQVYSNVCPHNFVQNQWGLTDDNKFRCNAHGNQYSTNCSSPSSLSCYVSSINGGILEVITN